MEHVKALFVNSAALLSQTEASLGKPAASVEKKVIAPCHRMQASSACWSTGREGRSATV